MVMVMIVAMLATMLTAATARPVTAPMPITPASQVTAVMLTRLKRKSARAECHRIRQTDHARAAVRA
eukprot:2728860-Pyramimonas_sp.AAC.1